MMKKIIVALLVLAALAGAVGYYQYNKGEANVVDAKALTVLPVDLYNDYTKDSVNAKAKYFDKIIEVKGVANAITTNEQKQTVVQIKTAADGAYINCTFDKPTDGADCKAGTEVTIKGVCKGIGEGDKDLGILGDVYLTRCYKAK